MFYSQNDKFDVIYIFCALKSKNWIIILSLYFFTCDQGAVSQN